MLRDGSVQFDYASAELGAFGHCVANPGHCGVQVYGSGVCCKTTTQIVKVAPPTDCETVIEDTRFYKGKQECPGTTLVPASVKSTKEKYRFEKKSFSVCGCTLKVCVPCAIDTEEREECRPVKKTVNMVARMRTENTGGAERADIWVYNEPGLPNPAVIAINVTSADANAQFGATFSY